MPGTYGYADPLFLLIAALALESYIGRVGWLARPFAGPRAWLVQHARSLELRLNRAERHPADRRWRGWLVVLVLLFLAWFVGWLLALFTRFYPFAWPLELLLLVLLLRQRRTWEEGNAVARGLLQGDLQAARAALTRLASGDLDPLVVTQLPRERLSSLAVTATARRLSDGLVSPVFWYVLLGPGGLALQQVSLLLGRLFGGTALHEDGGSPPAGEFAEGAIRVARLLDWAPSQLSALLLIAARLSLPEPPLRAFKLGAGRRAWPERVLVAALGPLPHDAVALRRALLLFSRAAILQLLLLTLLLLLRLVAASG